MSGRGTLKTDPYRRLGGMPAAGPLSQWPTGPRQFDPRATTPLGLLPQDEEWDVGSVLPLARHRATGRTTGPVWPEMALEPIRGLLGLLQAAGDPSEAQPGQVGVDLATVMGGGAGVEAAMGVRALPGVLRTGTALGSAAGEPPSLADELAALLAQGHRQAEEMKRLQASPLAPRNATPEGTGGWRSEAPAAPAVGPPEPPRSPFVSKLSQELTAQAKQKLPLSEWSALLQKRGVSKQELMDAGIYHDPAGEPPAGLIDPAEMSTDDLAAHLNLPPAWPGFGEDTTQLRRPGLKVSGGELLGVVDRTAARNLRAVTSGQGILPPELVQEARQTSSALHGKVREVQNRYFDAAQDLKQRIGMAETPGYLEIYDAFRAAEPGRRPDELARRTTTMMFSLANARPGELEEWLTPAWRDTQYGIAASSPGAAKMLQSPEVQAYKKAKTDHEVAEQARYQLSNLGVEASAGYRDYTSEPMPDPEDYSMTRYRLPEGAPDARRVKGGHDNNAEGNVGHRRTSTAWLVPKSDAEGTMYPQGGDPAEAVTYIEEVQSDYLKRENPNALRGDTGFTRLAMRDALHEAARKGHGAVALPLGEEQMRRYWGSQVEEIESIGSSADTALYDNEAGVLRFYSGRREIGEVSYTREDAENAGIPIVEKPDWSYFQEQAREYIESEYETGEVSVLVDHRGRMTEEVDEGYEPAEGEEVETRWVVRGNGEESYHDSESEANDYFEELVSYQAQNDADSYETEPDSYHAESFDVDDLLPKEAKGLRNLYDGLMKNTLAEVAKKAGIKGKVEVKELYRDDDEMDRMAYVLHLTEEDRQRILQQGLPFYAKGDPAMGLAAAMGEDDRDERQPLQMPLGWDDDNPGNEDSGVPEPFRLDSGQWWSPPPASAMQPMVRPR